MALQKTITDEIGVVTNYHAVKAYSVDFDHRQVQVYISSYTNKAIRDREVEKISNNAIYDELNARIADKQSEISALEAKEKRTTAEEKQLARNKKIVEQLQAQLPNYLDVEPLEYTNQAIEIAYRETLTLDEIEKELIAGNSAMNGAKQVE